MNPRTNIGTNPRIKALATAAAPYLTRGVELNALLEALVETIVRTIDADRGTLYLVDHRRGQLRSYIAHLPELEQIHLAFGQGIAGWVAQKNALANIDDPQLDARFDSSFDRKTGYVTNSILAVPLVSSQNEVIGVLQLLNQTSGNFSTEHEKAATELAGQAGGVLECTSIYAALKKGPIVTDESVTQPSQKAPAFRFNQIVGDGDKMTQVYTLVEKAARTSAAVLLTGESGTGKELIARAVHVNSPRRTERFVKVDCTTLPEALIENELFGHEKGAFTGADKTVPGKFEVAHRGTLFIDEIGELPLKLQGKLLRVLQDGTFERVGGTTTIKSDLRVICATHRDLLAMVRNGEFREDLYYRIRVVPIGLPPLRERGHADLQRLVEHFLDKFTRRHKRPVHTLTDHAWAHLKRHAFPGNIRELENCIESAVVLADDGIIDVSDLPLPQTLPRDDAGTGDTDLTMTLSEAEQRYIQAMLDDCDGNQSETARRLGIGRNTLARKLAQRS